MFERGSPFRFFMLTQCLVKFTLWANMVYCKICGMMQTILSNLTEQISKSSSEWCKSQAVYSRSSHWRSWNSACGRSEPCDVAQLIVFQSGNGIIFDYETFERNKSNTMPQTICSSSPRFSVATLHSNRFPHTKGVWKCEEGLIP